MQQDEVSDSERRQQLMQSVNPALVLRNWLAQRAIEAAEKGDMTELHRLHEALRNPFSDRDDDYVSRPPDGQTAGSQLLELKATWSTAACQPEFYGADILARHDR
ncbi:hypothetical protein ACLB1E_20840 [Escherichia coli]